jgi:DNA mismatch repair protein MutL
MPQIQVMSEHLSNKIAAGEVVERPAAVVKELVENAIDAKSTRIEIFVEEGGLQLISIIDNGQGMDREDSLLAFERHATSKLKNDQDLFKIATLGFRGEALPSIAAVAKVTLQTWNGSDQAGTEVQIEAGKVIDVKDAALRKGTKIEVTDLFFNTPARYKYLKTIHTELGHISDYINRMSLAHPEVAFHLRHNDKLVLKTAGNGDIQQVLGAIYGYQSAKLMLPLEGEDIDFKLLGYVSKPELTRASKQFITVTINGRYIKHLALHQAILRAYETLLPLHRYPIAVIHLTMDPTLLDINVHPSKLDVRISKDQALCSLVEASIKACFRRHSLIPDGSKSAAKKPLQGIQQSISFVLPEEKVLKQNNSPYASDTSNRDSTITRMKTADDVSDMQDVGDMKEVVEMKEVREMREGQEVREGIEAQQIGQMREKREMQDVSEGQEVREGPLLEVHDLYQNEEAGINIPLLFPLGQLHGTYILAQNENGLYLVDQHAAQERIWYEFFIEKLNHPAQANQELLFPLLLEFTAKEYVLIKDKQDELSRLGLALEEFGHHTYRVSSYPQWFPQEEAEAIIRETIEQICEAKGKIEWKSLRKEMAALMACKQSIKANQHLTKAEMEGLLEKLRKSSNPYTCPHGRPIIVLISTYEIEKMFKRVM